MSSAKSELIRFGIVGTINSFFGYFIGIGLFFTLKGLFTSLEISMLSNFIAIIFSFITQKMFVFRIKGNWLHQFLKGVIVYAIVAITGSGLFWLLIEVFKINVWFSQFIVISSTAAIGLIGSKFFTFKQNA